MERVIKYCTPTRLDCAPFGTMWKVVTSDTEHEYYVQLSHDANAPHWEKITYLLEKALERYFADDNFIIEMLKLFESEKHNFFEKTVGPKEEVAWSSPANS